MSKRRNCCNVCIIQKPPKSPTNLSTTRNRPHSAHSQWPPRPQKPLVSCLASDKRRNVTSTVIKTTTAAVLLFTTLYRLTHHDRPSFSYYSVLHNLNYLWWTP